MRTNMFGDPYVSPDDDLGAVFSDYDFDLPTSQARFIEEAEEGDITPGWGAEIANEDGEEIAHLEGFESREALLAYCVSHKLSTDAY